jgi:20S proteasome alpha/beta subunit
MTTIAYRDGIVAYDSRLTSDITIVDNNYNKCRIVNEVRFFFTGCASDYDRFIKAYFDESDSDADVNVILVDNKRIYRSGTSSEHKIWKIDITNMICSIGSGCDHALTAMDLGCTAAEAVRMAKKRDTCTGGRVRVFKVKIS